MVPEEAEYDIVSSQVEFGEVTLSSDEFGESSLSGPSEKYTN
jgi:hypothetical protein